MIGQFFEALGYRLDMGCSEARAAIIAEMEGWPVRRRRRRHEVTRNAVADYGRAKWDRPVKLDPDLFRKAKGGAA